MVAIASLRLFKDFFFLTIALMLSSLTFFPGAPEALSMLEGRMGALALLAGLIVIPSLIVHLLIRNKRDNSNDLFNLFLSLVLASNLAFLVNWQTGVFSRLEMVVLEVLCFFGLVSCGWSLVATHWYKIPLFMNRLVILGNGPLAEETRQLALRPDSGFSLKGFIECTPGTYHKPAPDAPMDESNRIIEAIRKAKANKIVVSLSERRGAFPLQEVLSCKLNGIEIIDAPEFYERVNRKLKLESTTPSWFIFASGFKIIGARRFVKRALDVVLALVGIVIVAPFLPLVALAIKLDSPGPVLFRQVRVGQGDREFVILKFRSMRQDAEKQTGAVWATQHDSRVTKLGAFLRKSRIDEIPQLFNVLAGSMSIVGPRPERPEFVKDLKKIIPYYSERHFVKPGITGWAQVKFPYGASVEDAIEKLRYDLYYIKNYSLLFDFGIMFRTIAVMAKKLGR